MVVLHHIMEVDAFSSAAWNRWTHLFQRNWLWVDFFFVLSGFVMTHVYGAIFRSGLAGRSYGAFMLRRLGRIYPLHLFMLLLFIASELAKYAVPSGARPPFSSNVPSSIVTNLLLVHSWHLHSANTWDIPSWSISAEFAAYLVFPFLIAALLNRTAALAATALAGFGALFALKTTLGNGSLYLTFDWGVLRCLPEFIIGILLWRWRAAPADPVKQVIGSDTILAATLAGVFLMLHLGVDDMAVIAGLCLLVFSGSLNTGVVGRILASRPLYLLGVLSYSIYMTHMFILRGFLLLSDRLLHSALSSGEALVALLVLLAAVIAMSTFTYRCVEAPGREAVRAATARWRDRAGRAPRASAAGAG
jgi:peptidoglycan/LPS O-acetylase OafA/YrhL